MARIIISTEKGYKYANTKSRFGVGRRKASDRAYKNYLAKKHRGDWERNMQGFSAWAGAKLQIALMNAQAEIMADVEKRKKYHNLTGNTYVSTMSVAVMGTRFRSIMGLPGAMGKQATRRKLPGKAGNGRSYTVRLFDNPDVVVKYPASKTIPTSGRYAKSEVIDKLSSITFGRNAKNQVISGILITTGTEYTSLLEKTYGLNVISRTKRVAGRIVKKHLGPLLKKYKQRRR